MATGSGFSFASSNSSPFSLSSAAATASSPLFSNSPAPASYSASPLFSSNPSSISTTNPSFGFGGLATTQASSLFGQSAVSGILGSNSSAAPLFGGSSAASSSAIGNTTGSGFGSSSSTDGLFGSSAPATGTSSASLVGTSSVSPLGAASSAGAASACMFGSSPSPFGAASSAGSTSTNFASSASLFGVASSASAGSAGIFGFSASPFGEVGSAGLLGTSSFGAASSIGTSSATILESSASPSGPALATSAPAKTSVPSSRPQIAGDVWHTDDQLKEHIDNLEKANPSHKMVVVLFYGHWAKYCKKFLGHFKGLVGHYSTMNDGNQVIFMKVSLDGEFKYLYVDYGVKSYPSVYIIRKGKVVEKFSLHQMTGGGNFAPEKVDLEAFTRMVNREIRRGLMQDNQGAA